MVKPRRRGGCEVNTGYLIEELVSPELMTCFCREQQGPYAGFVSWLGLPADLGVMEHWWSWQERGVWGAELFRKCSQESRNYFDLWRHDFPCNSSESK